MNSHALGNLFVIATGLAGCKQRDVTHTPPEMPIALPTPAPISLETLDVLAPTADVGAVQFQVRVTLMADGLFVYSDAQLHDCQARFRLDATDREDTVYQVRLIADSASFEASHISFRQAVFSCDDAGDSPILMNRCMGRHGFLLDRYASRGEARTTPETVVLNCSEGCMHTTFTLPPRDGYRDGTGEFISRDARCAPVAAF